MDLDTVVDLTDESDTAVDLTNESDAAADLTNKSDDSQTDPEVDIINLTDEGDHSFQSLLDHRSQGDGRRFKFLKGVRAFDFILRKGMTVEFEPKEENVMRNSDFLRIDKILQDRITQEVFLRGEVYVRTSFIEQQLPDKLNEVYLMRPNLNNDALHEVPYLQDITTEQILRTRTLIRTNQEYTHDFPPGCARSDIKQTGRLMCRWVYTQTYTASETDRIPRGQECCLRRLLQSEADSGYTIEDRSLRLKSRLFDDDHDEDISEECLDKSMSFGDFFGGGGGVGCGARAAGLSTQLMVDADADACSTYQMNFPVTNVRCMTVHDWIQAGVHQRLRIIHLSPPCQTFSPAHTINGRNDDANSAALFSVRGIVQMTRPDIVTMEETSGIQSHHREFLCALISELTSLGYSARWKILNCAEYGNPQPRKRMFLIASCPGQPLPPFPGPTHGPGPGLLPFVTVHDAISGVSSRDPNHDPAACIPRIQAPFSPHAPLRGCITCKGGDHKVHPSGFRDYTLQEFQRLQGFPWHHEFVGTKTSIMRQIGNACPPSAYQALLGPIIDALEVTDAVDAVEDSQHASASAGRAPGGSQDTAIYLDQEDEVDVDDMGGVDEVDEAEELDWIVLNEVDDLDEVDMAIDLGEVDQMDEMNMAEEMDWMDVDEEEEIMEAGTGEAGHDEASGEPVPDAAGPDEAGLEGVKPEEAGLKEAEPEEVDPEEAGLGESWGTPIELE